MLDSTVVLREIVVVLRVCVKSCCTICGLWKRCTAVSIILQYQRFCSFWDPFVAFLWGSSLQGFLRVDMKCLSKEGELQIEVLGCQLVLLEPLQRAAALRKVCRHYNFGAIFFVFFSYCSRCCEYLSGTHLSCRVCHYESSFVVFAFSYFAILQKKTMIFHFSNTCARENYRIWKFITELSCVTCNYLPVSSGSFWGAVP